jgi:hypothetical protein
MSKVHINIRAYDIYRIAQVCPEQVKDFGDRSSTGKEVVLLAVNF